jgi:nucleotide-binding universal stress UspA family protein
MEFKVVIPLDGSRYAEHALAYLPPTAHMGDVSLHLLSVVDDGRQSNSLEPSEEEERESRLLASYLNEIATDIRNHLKMKVSTEVLHGYPPEVIVEKSRRLQPDLLIISTHGHSGRKRWLRGSVADKVIRAAHEPILVLGPRAMEQGQWLEAELVPPFRRILVPLDGSEQAERALPLARRFAACFNSKLHLLRALPMPLMGENSIGSPVYSQEMLGKLVASGQEYLMDARRRHDLPDQTVTDVQVGGMPIVQIEEYIQGNEIDLVVMTSHARGGLSRLALGSVTDRLIGYGPPVLVVRGSEEKNEQSHA